MNARLALGTAQFGFHYGVSNRLGQPKQDEVTRILDIAADAGIELLDTACLYGDSEKVLGDAGVTNMPFRIVTKTPGFAETRDPAVLRATFEQSLRNLRLDRVYGLLVHHGCDLLADDGERLFHEMQHLHERGLVERLGASVYEPEELQLLLGRFPLDIVQIPGNVLDRRFCDDRTLDDFRSRGGIVCVRSIFLQGLLLMPPADVKAVHQEPVKRFQAAATAAGLTAMQAALAYARELKADHVVVGTNSVGELGEILGQWNAPLAAHLNWPALACNDPDVIDPRRWQQ